MPLTISTHWDPPNPIFNAIFFFVIGYGSKTMQIPIIQYDFPIFPLRGALFLGAVLDGGSVGAAQVQHELTQLLKGKIPRFIW